jgi:glycosyltransferase involved in cell wall biosynthesis
MRLVHFIYDDIENRWCGGGGAYRHRELCRRFAAAGHEVLVYSGNFPGARQGIVEGIRYFRLGSKRSYALSRLTYTIIANLIAPFIACDLLANDPSVFAPVMTFLYKRRRQVHVFHHFLGRKHLEKYPLAGYLFLLIEELFIRCGLPMIVSAGSVSRRIGERRHGRRVPIAIPNGFDETLLELPYRQGSHALYLGRFDFYMKGLDTLLDAFSTVHARSPSARLVMAGRAGDEDLVGIRSMVEQRGLSKAVDIRPNISAQEKRELLQTCLFMVMSSRFEGWGIAAIEAAAAGKMCIGSRIDGLTDTIAEGQNGFLCESGDVRAFSDQMEKLFKNPWVCDKHVESCRAWARTFSWDEIARHQMAIYTEIVQRT